MDWKAFSNKAKEKGGGVHYMVLKKQQEDLVKALESAGFTTKFQIDTKINVRRASLTIESFMKSLINFCTPNNGEIFIWRKPERKMFLTSEYANQCDVAIETDEIDGKPGTYDAVIITALGE
jgi:hypothetical protein